MTSTDKHLQVPLFCTSYRYRVARPLNPQGNQQITLFLCPQRSAQFHPSKLVAFYEPFTIAMFSRWLQGTMSYQPGSISPVCRNDPWMLVSFTCGSWIDWGTWCWSIHCHIWQARHRWFGKVVPKHSFCLKVSPSIHRRTPPIVYKWLYSVSITCEKIATHFRVRRGVLA